MPDVSPPSGLGKPSSSDADADIVYDPIMEGAGLSITKAAGRLGINRMTLSRLLNGHAGISAEMAFRLSQFLPNTDMTLWMNLQRDYDIWLSRKHLSRIRIKPLEVTNHPLMSNLYVIKIYSWLNFLIHSSRAAHIESKFKFVLSFIHVFINAWCFSILNDPIC